MIAASRLLALGLIGGTEPPALVGLAALIVLGGCAGGPSASDTRSGPAPLASALRSNPSPQSSAAQPSGTQSSGTPSTAALAPMRLPAVATGAPASSARGADASSDGVAVTKVRGVYKVGTPYVINGQTYVPAEDPAYDRIGIGSWYGHDFHGKQTANGETFDMNALTAAHPTLPLPSYVYVTNLRNGRNLLVRVNDRGPYKPGRIIDLSRGSARALAFEGNGTTDVRVRYAGRAPLQPDDRQERQFLLSQAWGRSVRPLGLGMGPVASRD